MVFLSYLSALLLLVNGIYLTIKSRFFQFKKLNIVFSVTFGKLISDKNTDGFKAMSIALGSTIGIGNIIGVTAAILIGGPGAVFWMLLTGFIGMIIKFAETYLSVAEAKENNRSFGGPMYVMKTKLNGIFKYLSSFFSIVCLLATFFAGNLIQSKSIYRFAEIGFNADKLSVSVLILPLLLIIITGRDRLYQNFSAIFVPIMSAFYICATVYIIFNNIENTPNAIISIFTSAFGLRQMFSGFSCTILSTAIRVGVMKGLFTNEAGMGSSPIAHSSAKNTDPFIQGCWGIVEVFIDTVIVCMLTAIAVLSSPAYKIGGFLGPFELICSIFKHDFGGFGMQALSISAICFAFASIVGWSFYGFKALDFFTRKKIYKKLFIIIFILCVPLSAFLKEEIIWLFTDLFNSLMLIPNSLTLLYLGGDTLNNLKHKVDLKR